MTLEDAPPTWFWEDGVTEVVGWGKGASGVDFDSGVLLWDESLPTTSNDGDSDSGDTCCHGDNSSPFAPPSWNSDLHPDIVRVVSVRLLLHVLAGFESKGFTSTLQICIQCKIFARLPAGLGTILDSLRYC